MRGRLTVQTLNSLIDNINSVLSKKYSTLCLRRKDVKQRDLTLYLEWKTQEKNLTKGTVVFVITYIPNIEKLFISYRTTVDITFWRYKLTSV